MLEKNIRVLIADTMHQSIVQMLTDAGFEPDYQPTISRESLENAIKDFDVLFIRSKTTIDEKLLSCAPKLKVIGRAGAGLDLIDLKAVESRRIKIINAPEGNRDAVAEHALGMLLCLFNKLLQADAQVRRGIWDREGNRGVELAGKTVGIIGYGYMGQAFAKRLSGFGCRVLAYDKYRTGFSDENVREVGLEEIQEEVDVVSFHIPLNEENRGLVSSDYLERFRKNIYIINTARGEILPFKVLVQGLRSGKIVGAVLDVLENEKLNQLTYKQKEYFSYIVDSENVILSPHVAGWTHESYFKINETLVQKLLGIKEYLED